MANAERAMSWPRSGSHGTTISLLLCLDLTKGQLSCSSVACWILLPHRRWGGFVREMLAESSLPEVKYYHLVFPQMSYFGCSTWDCSEGPDFLRVLSALFQKCHPLGSKKLSHKGAVEIWVSTSVPKSRMNLSVEKNVGEQGPHWKPRLPKLVPPQVAPERGGNPPSYGALHLKPKNARSTCWHSPDSTCLAGGLCGTGVACARVCRGHGTAGLLQSPSTGRIKT